jgi:phenylacetate-CoA ligase
MSLYSAVVRNLFTPLSLWRRGELRQLAYEREFGRTQFLSADELRDLQWRRLRPLIEHAYRRCPYYRRRFDDAGLSPHDVRSLDDVRRLPILEKSDVQRHAADMIAEAWPQHDLIRNQTGGSTGTPITFYLSKDRKCSRAAATLRHNAWAGWRVGDNAAVIWGAPRDRPGNGLRERIRRAVLREPLWLDTAAVTERSLVEFQRRLWSHKPTVIQAYARSAVLFARYVAENRLKPYRPRSIVTSAEVLEPADRELLEEVFGCPVFNRYGCREFSVVASECPAHNGLHVMAEGLLVEIDAPAGPAKPGQTGSILVTDLLNAAMPMIRYRIGDVASWAARPCGCGRSLPMLEEVAGRVTDFLVGSDGRLVSGVFLATYVVAHRPSLGQVQIRQTRAGHVAYRLRPGPGFDPAADGEFLRAATREFLGDGASCELELVQRLEAAASGKFLFSTSTVAPSFLGSRRQGVAPQGGSVNLARPAQSP